MGCCIIHSARLALAARLNSPQHGTVLFVISWSLHNQSHSGQLLISLETWGWLFSNSNNNSCRFSNTPPKLCRWHRRVFIYGKINNLAGHSCIQPSQGSLFFLLQSNIQFASFFQASACARQFISQLDFSWLCQVKTGANNHHTQWSLASPPLLSWLQVQSLHLNNIHHSCFYTPTWWRSLLYRDVTLFLEDNNGFVLSSSTIALNGE